MRNRAPLTAALIAMAALVSACAGGGGGRALDGTRNGEALPQTATYAPAVRVVPNAELDQLYSVAKTYLGDVFEVEYENEKERVIESPLLEWEVDQIRHRSRITIQVTKAPSTIHHGRLGVLAQKIETQVAFDEVRDGEPANVQWVCTGTIKDLQDLFADQIVLRYQLVRDGKDPSSIRPFEKPVLRSEGR